MLLPRVLRRTAPGVPAYAAATVWRATELLRRAARRNRGTLAITLHLFHEQLRACVRRFLAALLAYQQGRLAPLLLDGSLNGAFSYAYSGEKMDKCLQTHAAGILITGVAKITILAGLLSTGVTTGGRTSRQDGTLSYFDLAGTMGTCLNVLWRNSRSLFYQHRSGEIRLLPALLPAPRIARSRYWSRGSLRQYWQQCTIDSNMTSISHVMNIPLATIYTHMLYTTIMVPLCALVHEAVRVCRPFPLPAPTTHH